MKIKTYSQLIERLHEAKAIRGELAFIAARSGVPYGTLYRIATGLTESPGIAVTEKLFQYMSKWKPR